MSLGISAAGWIAIAATASSAYSAHEQAGAAKDAANAAKAGAGDAAQTQWDIFNQTRQDQSPYRYIGGQALNSLAAANGLTGYSDPAAAPAGGTGSGVRFIPGGGSGGLNGGWSAGGVIPSPTPSGGGGSSAYPGQTVGTVGAFQASPGYNFVRSEGQRGVEQSAAARGGAFSGNALRALSDYNSGLASQEYGNWYNRMASLAGVGQTATNSLSAVGPSYASGIGTAQIAGAQANASGIIGAGNAYASGINSLASLYGNLYGRSQSPYGSYGGP